MSLCEAKLEISFKSALADLTEKYPKSKVMIWCNAQIHLYEFHSGDEEELVKLEAEAEKLFEKCNLFKRSSTIRFLSTSCDCGSENVSTVLQDEQCWYVQPIIFEAGKANYRVVCPDRESIRKAIRSISSTGYEVNLLSVRDFNFCTFADEMFISPSNILSGVTSRQLSALADAFSEGYFEEPAKVDIDELAKRAKISRSTYSEHLRKAEAKLLSNLAPFIKMAVEKGPT
jgi:predicted DNA binding protein